ncbi:MAG: hypothetical protein A7315_07235 [Candidatus Altiarchaeales archaeon WOR_SM1_79]|nr:MAG: hypothetical protein A7315_07235 [Candidatus Altiarchaeales archaeon WOR_SM1_79]
MRTKVLFIVALLFASLLIFAVKPVSAAPDYELTKYDPREDVLRVRTGGDFKFDDWDNVEITKMTSTYVSGIPTKIQLTMTVVGTIQNNEDYKYIFVVVADGDEYIFAAYQNNAAIGFKLGENQLIPPGQVTVSGAGSKTLTITFWESAIDNPSSSYDFSGGAVYSEGEYMRYLDLAPDKLILITEPSDLSTVSGGITIKGVIRESIEPQPGTNVKININNEGWVDVTGTDPWSYYLDTTGYSDEIPIKVMVKGTEYEDEITIKIDQDTGNYESFDQKPSVHVGDSYHYESLGQAQVSGINLEITNEMDTEIQSYETITVDGTDYETYKVYTYTEGEQDLGYISYDNKMQRWGWRDLDSFGTVKEYTRSQTTVTPFRPQTTVDTNTTYDPPFETHSDYSVTVGFSNKWPFHTTSDSESTTTVAGDNEPTENPPYNEPLDGTGECLYYKSSHNVFGNNFQDIYVIRTYYENPGMSVVEYYSPELGVPVQIDTYDPSRNLMFSLGLDSYERMPFSIAIGEVTFNPMPPKAENKNKITIEVKNVGIEDATNIKITVMDGSRQVGQKTIDSILAGDDQNVEFDWTPKAEGNHTIKITASSGSTNLDEKIEYVDVEPKDGDVVSNMLFILLLIVIVVIVIILVLFMLMKRKGKKEEITGEKPEEAAKTEGAAVAATPVVVAAEEEPVVAPTAQAEPSLTSETIVCPSCKQNFTVQYQSKPVRVKCPSCGTEGVLN